VRGILVDSHVFLWSLYEAKRLSSGQRQLLDGDHPRYLSVATIWEVEIKKNIGKLPIPENIWEQASKAGYTFLAINVQHARLAGSLPLHHRDPFDRMLIAQAKVEGLTVLTTDPAFRAYEVALA